MRTAVITVLVATALACGSASISRAGGDQNRERHRKSWAGTKPTVEARSCLRTRDRCRSRDGSCGTEAGDQDRDRDRTRDRARDGSCCE